MDLLKFDFFAKFRKFSHGFGKNSNLSKVKFLSIFEKMAGLKKWHLTLPFFSKIDKTLFYSNLIFAKFGKFAHG